MVDRTVAVRLLLNPAGYLGGAAQVQRANASMAASTAATATKSTAATTAMSAGMKRTGASMASVGASAGLLRGGLTTPLTAAGAAVVGVTKASIDWESSWAGVTKTVDGSATQMERLEGDLRSMTRELPASHGEIASVAEAAGQLGVKVDDVASFSRVMVDLGETTNLSADQAATSIARLTNIMGTSQGDVDNLGSALVDLGNNSATTEAEILTLGTRLAAAGNIAGLSESDVLAFAAAMTSVGVNAEAGGTAMSKVFTTMRDAVLNGGAALDTFAGVAGATAHEFATAFREDPAMAVASFIEGLGRMNAAGESTTGVFEDLQLTDQRLMRALLSTAEAGDLLTDSIELSSDAWEENLALSEEAANRYDTTAAKLSTSMNRLKDQAIGVGDELKPIFEDLAKGFADIIELGSADIFSGSEEGLQQFGNVLRDWGVPEQLLLSGAPDAIDESAGMVAKFRSEIDGLNNRMPQAVEDAQRFRTAQLEVSESTLTAADSLANYQEMLRSSVDPVFGLFDAVRAVDEQQREYNDAVKEYGENSPEAEEASINLAKAVATAQQAALDGELSFDAFDAKLQRWVEQGVITEGQAETLRGVVGDLNDTADDFDGARTAEFDTEGVAKSNSEIQGLLNRAARWSGHHTANFSATYSSNLVAGAVGNLLGGRGHAGGMVTTAGVIPRMHDGGVANTVPSFHNGSSRLASDEVPAILQTGEVVSSRGQVSMAQAGYQMLGKALAPMVSGGGMVGGGSAGAHDMAGGALTIENHIEVGGEVVRVVSTEISAHDRRLGARVRAGTGRAR